MIKFKVGDKVKVVGNTSGHGWDIGQVVELEEKAGVQGEWGTSTSGNFWFMQEKEFEAVEPAKEAYEEGKWYGWNGGECPVDGDTVVDIYWGHQEEVSFDPNERADSWDWYSKADPIIVFRIVPKTSHVFVGWVDGIFYQKGEFFEGATHKLYEDMTLEEIDGLG